MPSANQVFLHVGTMKSGTSYLQSVLRRNREALTEAGVLAPRRMVAAASDALGNKGGNRTMDIRGEWSRVVTEIGAWQGQRVIASHEFLAAASAEQALSIIQSLAPHRVTVVITARDLLRVIPSHWQTVIKGAKTWSFGDYVRYLLDEPGTRGGAQRAHAGFWRHHDLARVVAAWGDAVGLANVVVVTVPPPGAPADLLWKRFADVVGLESARYDHEPDAQSNVSMSYAETEMLRQINVLVEPELSPFEYRSIVNNYFANELMRDGPHDDTDDRPRLGARIACPRCRPVAHHGRGRAVSRRPSRWGSRRARHPAVHRRPERRRVLRAEERMSSRSSRT